MDLRDRLVSALEESESSGLEDKNDVISPVYPPPYL